MCIDETPERAIELARPYFEEHAKFMAPLGMLRYSEEHVRAVAARQAQSAAGASLENGLLHVDLVREIPEAKKPRQIPIGSGKVVDAKVEAKAA